MKYLSLYNLRAKLILLALAALLPSAALTVYSSHYYYHHTITQLENHALSLTRISVGLHDQVIEGTRQILFSLSQMPPVRQHDKSACAKILARYLESSAEHTGFVAALPNGDVFSSAPEIGMPVNIGDRSWFQQALRSRDYVLGIFTIGRISKKPTTVIGYPVLDDAGQLKAVILAGLNLEWLNQIVNSLSLPAASTIMVIDGRGNILMSNDAAGTPTGKSLSDMPIIKKILAEKSNT